MKEVNTKEMIELKILAQSKLPNLTSLFLWISVVIFHQNEKEIFTDTNKVKPLCHSPGIVLQ